MAGRIITELTDAVDILTESGNNADILEALSTGEREEREARKIKTAILAALKSLSKLVGVELPDDYNEDRLNKK